MAINTNINTIVTNWVAYTPTITSYGTPTSVSFFSRRIGNALEIRGKFTSGTATAVESQITLGYNGTNANVNSSSTIVASIQNCGEAVVSFTGANFHDVLIESNVGYITIGVQNGSRAGLTKTTGTVNLGSSNTMSLFARIPVDVWP